MNPTLQRSCLAWIAIPIISISMLMMVGCGATTQRLGTEQLLMSDAVDLAVSKIDFHPLNGERIYLDTSYLQSIKGVGFVNAPYIISSLRQQLTAAGCMLQDNRDEADVIVEARVGALGTDGHEVTYGLPKNNLLSSAAAVIPGAPSVPVIPEISAARVDAQSGIAKIMVFAYDGESRKPIWQSGVARAESTSRNSWILGAGPFQRGSVHQGTRFAGEVLDPRISDFGKDEPENIAPFKPKPGITYFQTRQFQKGPVSSGKPKKRIASKPDDATKPDDETEER